MKEKLKKLRCNMRCKRIFFYFTRNNPAHTYRYYCRFIEIIGPENYLRSPIVRNEWEGARYSFDKMYGLVSAWCEDFCILNADEKIINDLKEHFSSFYFGKISSLKKECDCFEKELVGFIRDSDEEEAKIRFKNFMSIRERISGLEANKEEETETDYSALCSKVKKSEEIIEIYRQLAEFAISEKRLLEKKLADEKNKKESKTEENKPGENKTEEKK